MIRKIIYKCLGVAGFSLMLTGCVAPYKTSRTENKSTPASFNGTQDSLNTATVKWREFYNDPYLSGLIDTALKNNQELNITMQEIEISRNEVRARKGEYLPFVGGRAGAGFEKPGRYTLIGALENTTEVATGVKAPDPLSDYLLGFNATWEVDIWKKLRNARKSAVYRYLSTMEGKNFMVTNLVSEIARSYYELLALDNQLDIVNKNIRIQTDALEVVKLQKDAARVTELAVRRFEAQLLNTRSMQYNIQQRITETENQINFLLGRFPQHIERSSQSFDSLVPKAIHAGLPSQLLINRPDIRQAEKELAAAKLDIKVARAQFYPSFGIRGFVGLNSFSPSYFLATPQSLTYALFGDLMAPLVNRNAIKATYYSANAKQIQAVYNYERTIVNGYVQVANQLAMISNMQKKYDLKSREVQALSQSIDIANDLFKSARADYMEVLFTQRDALESKFDLIEVKMLQLNAVVNIYQALGGGWK